jgi:hypothetical protein
MDMTRQGRSREAPPYVTTEGDDLIVGFEDAVGQLVLPHELPEVLDLGSISGNVAATAGRRSYHVCKVLI